VYILLLLLPIGALLISFLRQRRRSAAAAIVPFSELRRRPAGESVRLEIEDLSERINRWILCAAASPIILGLTLAAQQERGTIGVTLFFLSAALFCGATERRVFPLLRKRSNHRLRYQGERYVAEELNRLMAYGFHAFHDVPFDHYYMDHVLVGPTGVFVVETKTMRKPQMGKGDRNAEVIFDGSALLFPDGPDGKALEHVRSNRDTISRWLSSATADQICAEGILTIPGWNIARIGRSDIYVVNARQIRQLILSCTQFQLTPAEIQRACHQLEQKCIYGGVTTDVATKLFPVPNHGDTGR
jgi:hypothetical protein